MDKIKNIQFKGEVISEQAANDLIEQTNSEFAIFAKEFNDKNGIVIINSPSDKLGIDIELAGDIDEHLRWRMFEKLKGQK